MKRLKWDDRGQITTALVIVVTVLVVGLAMLATKLGQATDEKSQVQIAADAAALAAAQQIRQDAPARILAAIGAGGGGGFGSGLGQDAASDFATRGGARLVQYRYYPLTDTVQVSVDSLTNSVSGSPAQATAKSQVGLSLDDCVLPPTPTPTPTTSATTPPPTTPPTTSPTTPPPDVDGQATCGDLTIPIVFDGATGVITIGLSESEIRDKFTPALTS